LFKDEAKLEGNGLRKPRLQDPGGHRSHVVPQESHTRIMWNRDGDAVTPHAVGGGVRAGRWAGMLGIGFEC